jgi:hypothetical protein
MHEETHTEGSIRPPRLVMDAVPHRLVLVRTEGLDGVESSITVAHTMPHEDRGERRSMGRGFIADRGDRKPEDPSRPYATQHSNSLSAPSHAHCRALLREGLGPQVL